LVGYLEKRLLRRDRGVWRAAPAEAECPRMRRLPGLRVYGLGLGGRVWSFGFRVWDLGFRVWGLGLRIEG